MLVDEGAKQSDNARMRSHLTQKEKAISTVEHGTHAVMICDRYCQVVLVAALIGILIAAIYYVSVVGFDSVFFAIFGGLAGASALVMAAIPGVIRLWLNAPPNSTTKAFADRSGRRADPRSHVSPVPLSPPRKTALA
jgi:hypothetical protein